MEMSVPKIFLRKIIGHQSRNLYEINYNLKESHTNRNTMWKLTMT